MSVRTGTGSLHRPSSQHSPLYWWVRGETADHQNKASRNLADMTSNSNTTPQCHVSILQEDQPLPLNIPKRKNPVPSSKQDEKKQNCVVIVPTSNLDSDVELDDDDTDDADEPNEATLESRLPASATMEWSQNRLDKNKEEGDIEENYDNPFRKKMKIGTSVLPSGSPDKGGKDKNEKCHNLPRKIPTQRSWKKEDIYLEPLPVPQLNSNISRVTSVQSPFVYFKNLFNMELIKLIVFQTNLYAKQKDSNTTFSTDKDELLVFLGILIYMSICSLPTIEDYWAAETRVAQVADKMSSNRFKLLRCHLHFNNNKYAQESNDGFYKIRPIFNSITMQFLRVSPTSKQCIGDITVPYNDTRPGNLREYTQYNPETMKLKLFCRSSEDGFIHDIVMYQGENTFSCHHTKLSAKESEMMINSKAAIALVKTLKNPANNVIYSNDYFTSIELVEYLRHEYRCRYTGTAKTQKIGNPPLRSNTEMEKTSVPRGSYDFTSSEGILALKWKDDKTVTIISSDAGVLPVSSVLRYDKSVKAKVEVPCPHVIKNCDGRLDVVKRNDILAHVHKTPMRAKRWYLKLFGYALDLCISNAWLRYRRDCQFLEKNSISLKDFRLSISHFARNMGDSLHNSSTTREDINKSPVNIIKRGQRAILPSLELRLNSSKHHMPVFDMTRQTCKHCSKKDDIHRSRWMCDICQVALCLSETRNCFIPFHSEATEYESETTVSCSTEHSVEQEDFDEVVVKEEDLFDTIYMVKQEVYDNDFDEDFDDIEVKEEDIHDGIHSVKQEVYEHYDIDDEVKSFPFLI